MYKIIIDKEVRITIENFILSYKSVFEKRFFDSGIEDEEIIIWFYIQKWDLLEKEINAKITFNLSNDEIFWYKLYENWEKSIKIFLKSFMLEVFFEEDVDEKVRFIEEIKINKK